LEGRLTRALYLKSSGPWARREQISCALADPTRGKRETYNERFSENGLENAARIFA
jgi:hypothetical protein